MSSAASEPLMISDTAATDIPVFLPIFNGTSTEHKGEILRVQVDQVKPTSKRDRWLETQIKRKGWR